MLNLRGRCCFWCPAMSSHWINYITQFKLIYLNHVICHVKMLISLLVRYSILLSRMLVNWSPFIYHFISITRCFYINKANWYCLIFIMPRPGVIKRWCCLTSGAYIWSAGGVCGRPAGWRVLADRARFGRSGWRLPLGNCIDIHQTVQKVSTPYIQFLILYS